MKKLEEDIKNGTRKNVYLLFGPQGYQRNRYRDGLIKLLLPDGDSVNLAKYEGSKINPAEIIDLAETMPFFAERRVIVLENTGFFAGECDERLVKYMESIPETTCFIFSEEKADARLKLYKAVEKYGCVAKFMDPRRDEIRDFVLKRLTREHRPITEHALEIFLDGCGNDYFNISNELDKLVSYTFGKDGIRPEDVNAVVTSQVEDKIFLMIDALFRHNADEAMGYYADLLTLQKTSQQTFALLSAQLRLIFNVREMDLDHMGVKEIAASLGMSEPRIKKSLPLARRSSKIWIMKGLGICAGIEEDIKSGRIDAQIGLESAMIELGRDVK